MTPRRIDDPSRPTCPVCGIPTAVYTSPNKGERRYRCNLCGVTATAALFVEVALAKAAGQDEAAIPLPTVLERATIRHPSRRGCEHCFSLRVCAELERQGRPVQCESVGRVWVNGTLCEV